MLAGEADPAHEYDQQRLGTVHHQRVGNTGLLADTVGQQNTLHHYVKRPNTARHRRGHPEGPEREHSQARPLSIQSIIITTPSLCHIPFKKKYHLD